MWMFRIVDRSRRIHVLTYIITKPCQIWTSKTTALKARDGVKQSFRWPLTSVGLFWRPIWAQQSAGEQWPLWRSIWPLPLPLLWFIGCLSAEMCLEGKINQVLISVCSCLAGRRNHRESAAVNVNTLQGRLWKGAGRGGEGCKREARLPFWSTHAHKHTSDITMVIKWLQGPDSSLRDNRSLLGWCFFEQKQKTIHASRKSQDKSHGKKFNLI